MANFGYNVKIGADTREFEKGMRSLGKSVKNIGKSMQSMADDFKWISATAAGALAGIVKTSVDFEDAWVGVTKTVEGTEEQLAKVKQEIIDMSKATGISKNEIAGVAQVAGQLGIATDDLSAFTKVMVDLGIATDMSAEDAAMSLARLANITQMSSKDYDRLGAAITDLGNNYAVTESEIVEMATRLASTGDLVGLNQAQILALATAMGSLGSEAEAGGTAMSKMFRKMQLAVSTNNDQLGKFAEVAGMSVSDFKKAFEKDALGALNLFVKGLQKIEDNGGSAIATLDDMKLSEVRLSDATLRLVGSGDLLDRTISTANKAWEENTALAKEAGKRYDEVKYQWGQVKETLGDLALQLGNVLLPIAKKALTNIQKWLENLTKKLGSMSQFEKENILKVLAAVALISPALKVAGSAIEGFGKAIMLLASPTNLAIAAIGALLVAMYAYAKYQKNEIYGMKGLASALEEEKESWNNLKEAREKTMESSSTEIAIIQKLRDELGSIVDENGKVKEGYENRASFITGELNKALGTEIELNGNIIENYKDITGEIDNLIRAKKTEAVLNAYQEEYGAALKGQAKAVEHLTELKKQYNEQVRIAMSTTGWESAKAQMAAQNIGKAIGEQTELISEYGYTIQNYEALQTASISNSAEEIDKALENMSISWKMAKTSSEESLTAQIANQRESVEILSSSLSEARKIHDDYQAGVLEGQLKAGQERLSGLYDELTNEVNLVDQLTPQQAAAFKHLAEEDVLEYIKQASQLSPETQKQLEKVTGVITTNTSVPNASKDMGNRARTLWSGETSKMVDDQNKTLGNVSSAISSNTSVSTASGNLGTRTKTEFSKNADGTQSGIDFTSGVGGGIQRGQGSVFGIVRSFGASLLSNFRASLQEQSPSKATAEMGKYFVEGFTNGITTNQYSAINSVRNLADKTLDAYNTGMNIDALQTRINGNMEDKTKVVTPSIAIYTQQLDDQKLEQIVRYVDRRFGAAI